MYLCRDNAMGALCHVALLNALLCAMFSYAQ